MCKALQENARRSQRTQNAKNAEQRRTEQSRTQEDQRSLRQSVSGARRGMTAVVNSCGEQCQSLPLATWSLPTSKVQTGSTRLADNVLSLVISWLVSEWGNFKEEWIKVTWRCQWNTVENPAARWDIEHIGNIENIENIEDGSGIRKKTRKPDGMASTRPHTALRPHLCEFSEIMI